MLIGLLVPDINGPEVIEKMLLATPPYRFVRNTFASVFTRKDNVPRLAEGSSRRFRIE